MLSAVLPPFTRRLEKNSHLNQEKPFNTIIMSPSRIDEPTDFWDPIPAKRSIFPDGIKTSGQQEPIYSLVRPYEDFPTHIAGPTVWKASDFKDNAEKWTHHFTEEEISEISSAADKYIEQDPPLTGITKVRPLRTMRYQPS